MDDDLHQAKRLALGLLATHSGQSENIPTYMKMSNCRVVNLVPLSFHEANDEHSGAFMRARVVQNVSALQ